MEPKRALSHPKRREILDYLTERGGAGEAELIEALGLTAVRVKYHLGVMRDAGLVVHVEGSERDDAGRFYVAADSAST
jgi:DNA-binding transcriptional ArsR family regulator